VKVVSFSDLARDFRRQEGMVVEDAVAEIRRTVKLHGPRLVQEEIASISPPPVDRTIYRRSWKFEDIPHGAVIYNYSKHGAIIEEGRRPGAKAPPIAVIADWVRRKKLVRGSGRAAEAEIRQAAFLIARAIKRRGLPARHVLQLASRRLEPIVRQALERRLGRAGAGE